MGARFGLSMLVLLGMWSVACGQSFESRFDATPPGVWLGPSYWANPLQDWRLQDGRLECLSTGANRSVHLLTYQPTERATWRMQVTLRRPAETFRGAVGMRFGIQGKLDDYRYNAIWGSGILAALQVNGKLVLAEESKRITWSEQVTLSLELQPQGDRQHQVSLTALDEQANRLATLTTSIESSLTRGNVALVSQGAGRGKRSDEPVTMFRAWKLEGDRLEGGPDQQWGPILWTQYTLSRDVLKLQAQLAPVNGQGDQAAQLQVLDGDWQTIARATMEPRSRTILFRVPRWDASRDVPLRVLYRWAGQQYEYRATVRKDPRDQAEVSIAGFTGNKDYGFPNPTIVANLQRLDPDVLFFSGDQLYESNAGFGITREPVEIATLDYLRKWYLVGWSFGELMRDRPAIHLPDDHDVYQGNIWGAGGRPTQNLNQGGYLMDPVWVNMVQRTQTGHLPDPVDPGAIEQGIGVYFTEMVYGRVGMAILEDRKFKAGPPMIPDKFSLEEAPLLGERQLAFLGRWAADWRGQEAKVTLSQTVFGQCHTYGGRRRPTRTDDQDANGWPPPGRDRAIRAIRKGHALMFAGDNHLPTVVHHGVDTWEDAGVSFTVPSIAAGFPREWRPDRIGIDREGPLPMGLAQPTYRGDAPEIMGRFTSSWGHPLTFYAVGNPLVFTGAGGGQDAGDLQLLDDKRSGFGLVRFDKPAGKIRLECYRILADLEQAESAQMKGWPVTLEVRDNYARKPFGHLPEVSLEGVDHPVLIVTQQKSGELVYALRLRDPSIRPWVFADGAYRVRLGDPDTGRWQSWSGLRPGS